eukprot:32107_6
MKKGSCFATKVKRSLSVFTGYLLATVRIRVRHMNSLDSSFGEVRILQSRGVHRKTVLVCFS